jgi:putative redox protein
MNGKKWLPNGAAILLSPARTSPLKKKRQNLQDFQVRVRGKRADTYPKVYTDIEVEYHLWGIDIDSKAVEQAIQLSEEKYCSASAMLKDSANISSAYIFHAPGDKLGKRR